jgi:UDP-3-O-[3-hydroxymyristoyl] glucosamine N-acyltransferase
MMSYRLGEIAELLGAECRGDAECLVKGVATLESAKSDELTFLVNPRYRKYLPTTEAAAVILSAKEAEACPVNALVMSNPYVGYAKVAALFAYQPARSVGIHPTVVVGKDCSIHPTASIGAYCVLGDAVKIAEGVVIGPGTVIGDQSSIGAHSELKARVTFYHHVRIGERVIVHSGCVIGADGFGMANEKGVWHKIEQLGGVLVGDDVEIGANTTVDRGALGDTVIETGVKLDNQIQVGHNAHIGAHTAVAGCVAIAGSTQIGKYCMIGGGACIGGHLTIADRSVITGLAMITHSITESGTYSSGTGFQESHAWRRSVVRFHQLDDMARRIKALEKNGSK